MLTGRQQAIYDFILQYRRDNGCSPSIPEIQREFGIRSPNGVAGHLHALEAKGYLRRGQRGSRQMDPSGPNSAERGPIADLPMYGQIAAGYPEAQQATRGDAFLSLDEATLGFRPKDGCFALRVRGDSMKDVGIFSGDTVVVEPTPEPRENQIVAALIDGESTLKRLVRVRGKWFLKAENSDYPELHPRSDLVIQGVVRTVIRRLS
ncbi:MAG: repressor LexA [Candidatus Solibacter usitatus]|nr:repressor LexA [Candidatus Solibacter usitatus]